MAYSNIGLLFNKHYFEKPSNPNFIDFSNLESTVNETNIATRNNLLFESTLNNKTPFAIGNSKIVLQTTYPGLVLGTGSAHESSIKGELKLGFFFDYTTGLPVLPGSSVKGVLSSAFDKADGKYVNDLLEEELKIKKIDIKALKKAIFNNNIVSVYQKDIFYDAFPIGTKPAKKFINEDYITPHNKGALKNPIPLKFLKVMPNVNFQFNFNLVESGGLTAIQKRDLFKLILLDLGIGAKTNVGYGQMIIDPKEEQRLKNELAEAEKIASAIKIAKNNKIAEKERKEKAKKDAEELKIRQEANRENLKNIDNVISGITNFNTGTRGISKYMKANKLSDLTSEKDKINVFVKNCYNAEKENSKKKRDWKKKGKNNWSKIGSWVGQEIANSWYDEIINQL